MTELEKLFKEAEQLLLALPEDSPPSLPRLIDLMARLTLQLANTNTQH